MRLASPLLRLIAAITRLLAVLSLLTAATGAFVGRGAMAETVSPVFRHDLPDAGGKTLTVVTVDFPPGGRAAPHRHGQAFVFAYVLAGQVRSQLAGEPAATYSAGQSWSEPPGAHHVLTENTSVSEPARLLVVFVAQAGAELKLDDP